MVRLHFRVYACSVVTGTMFYFCCIASITPGFMFQDVLQLSKNQKSQLVQFTRRIQTVTPCSHIY